ncbi:FtsX-like permease family protein [Aerococcaceae bacterium DSM 111176]|nr:FtsX-like permease family protein [Aerococcaceae bacterium DSM 111176]
MLTDFVLDAQMNSTLASSTRILLSDTDYQQLAGQMGEYEHLIEVYFSDSDTASSFQTLYEDANLPQNGQAVTYTMMFLLSAFTDLTTVFLLLTVSIILIFIAFICLRFTIAVALEEDIKEIGVLKAIGFSNLDIRQIYLSKYRFLALIAVIIGFLLSIFLSDPFTERINTTFGETSLTGFALILGGVIAVLIYGLIMLFCRRILRKIDQLSVVDALVSGKGFSRSTKKRLSRDGLSRMKFGSLNWRMSSWEVFFQFKEWAIVSGVVLLAILMIVFPLNLLTTFQDPGFATYMGSDVEDILIEIENNEQLESNYQALIPLLDTNPQIERYQSYRGVSATTRTLNDERVNVHIDIGENAGRSLQYIEGQAPDENNEISLSFMNAERLGKEIGDTIAFDSEELILSGIYQDVTSGGYTAKTSHPFPELKSNKYTMSLALRDDADPKLVAEQLAGQVGQGVNVAPMAEFLDQTLGSVTQQIQGLVFLIVGVGLFMAILITVLFLQLRLARDRASIATLKAIGFTNLDVKKQYIQKSSIVTVGGIVLGLILTLLSSNFIINLVLSMLGLGIKEVDLIMNPLIVFCVVPLIMLITVGLTTYIVSSKINQYKIVDIINE